MGCNQTSFSTQKIIFWRRFVESYGLYSKILSPKCLKLGKDFEKTKVKKVFGSCITKNGYLYTWCGDEGIIVELESLWMITHQITSLPHTQIINKTKAWGFVGYKFKGKDIN
jgi:hypothetical protein